MPLTPFPPEVWLQVSQYVDDENAAPLCLSCRHLFTLLLSKLYNGTVTLTEDATSGSRVLALAQGPRAYTVRTLRYTPTDPKPLRETEYDGSKGKAEHDPSVKLSDEAAEVMRSLGKFPNLELVDMALDDWVADWPGLSICFRFDFEEYHSAEGVEPWRVLLAESFRALAQSRGAFPKLRIQGLPPAPQYAVFKSELWHHFLSGLQSFEIVLLAMEDQGNGSMTVDHEEFVKRIPEMFLNHATGLEHLRLLGDDDGYIGHYYGEDPMSWADVNMPRLKSFELKCSYANEQLGEFLARHLGTLENVKFQFCMAAVFSDWEYILNKMVASEKLVEFTVVGYDEGPDAIDCQFSVGETCESYGQIQFSHRHELEEEDQFEVERQKAEVARLWNTLQARVARSRAEGGLPALPDTSLQSLVSLG